MCRSGFQSSERRNAFGHCVYASSTSTRMPSCGTFPSTSLVGEQLGVVDDPRAAVDPERVVDARDEEEQRDPVVGEEIRERVGELVARAVREEESPLVEDANEAGRVAARRDVETAVRASRGDDDERRPLDELPRERVEPVRDLLADERGRLTAEHLAQLGLVHHENLGGRFSRTAATPSRTSGPVMSRNSSASEASKIGPAV